MAKLKDRNSGLAVSWWVEGEVLAVHCLYRGRCMTQKRLVVSHLPMARDVAPSPESLSVNSTSPTNGIRYDRPR